MASFDDRDRANRFISSLEQSEAAFVQSILTMAEPSASRIHFPMAVFCLVLFVLAIFGQDFDIKTSLLAGFVLFPLAFLLAIIRHDRGQIEKRDAALVLPWAVAIGILFPPAIVFSARFRFPLRDSMFTVADHAMGIDVGAIMRWTRAHSALDSVLTFSYIILPLFLFVALALPAILGRKEIAERFLIANVIALGTAFPIFALLPAIGPWRGYGFVPDQYQTAIESIVLSVRNGGLDGASGIVCLPSFHVIWAILSAWALWKIRPLRWLATILAALIVLSTMTTGWHYAIDVVGGVIVAAIAISTSRRLISTTARR